MIPAETSSGEEGSGSCCEEMARVPPRLRLVSTHLWIMEAWDEFHHDILPFSWCPWCGTPLNKET